MRHVHITVIFYKKISIFTNSTGVVISYEKLIITPTTSNLKNEGEGK